MNYNHLDIFSGIGGFALAAKWAGLQTVQFVEIDPFCQKVLQKNFPGVKIHDDIKTFKYSTYNSTGGELSSPYGQSNGLEERGMAQLRNTAGQPTGGDGNEGNSTSPFLLTGGFPCQPFSCAGKRRGKEDDRYLWPEMLRVVSEAKPTWIIGENVAGIESIFQYDCFSEMEGKEYLSREAAEADFNGIYERTGTNTLYLVVEDLKKLGYEVQPFIVPACSKNAPHRRDRVWIVAHTIRAGAGSYRREVDDQGRRTGEGRREGIRQGNGKACSGGLDPTDCHAPDTKSQQTQPTEPRGLHAESCGTDRNVADAKQFYGENTRPGREPEEIGKAGRNGNCGYGQPWSEPWLEAATRLCRVDDGLLRGLVKNRVSRLKALGNAIVPQIPYEIMKAILAIEHEEES